MNSFSYMDKKITEFSNSQTPTFFNDEDDKEQEQADEDNDQDHSFHFHSFRSLQSSSRALDGTQLRGWNSMGRIDSAQLSDEKVTSFSETELIARIDQKLKEHTDVLLHSVEYLSARVSQMETRVRQVQNSFDGLKESVEFSHGKTDGKLRELENILLEVHGDIKDLKDKQEIADAQAQLAKLQMSNDGPKLEKKNTTVQTNSLVETSSSISQQSNQPLLNLAVCPQPATAFSSSITNIPLQNHLPVTPTVPSAGTQIGAPSSSHLHMVAATAPQIPSQIPQNSFPCVSGTRHQQFVLPTQPAQQTLHPHQPSQPPPHLPLSSRPPQLPQAHPPFSIVDPRVDNYQYYHEERTYPPSHDLQKSSQLHNRSLPPHNFNVGSTRWIPDQPSNFCESQSVSANLRGQGLQTRAYTGTRDYHYTPHTGSSTMKPSQSSLSSSFINNEINYSKLPTARTLPHALPTASAVESGSNSEGGGNRVPVDDVVDKVVAMGFRRDTVRAMVKKLTEYGQSVDLNVVLDKLMNNG